MSRGKDLLKNTGILMVAKISTQLVNFLLLPLYTALLSTSEYGQLDIYNSLSMILIPFATLQIEQGIFRFALESKGREDMESIISSGVFSICATVILMTIVYLVANLIVPIPNSLLLYFYFLTLILTTVWFQIARGFGKNVVYGMASFLSSAIAVGLNVLFVLGMHMNVPGILYASIISNLISTIYMVFATNSVSYFKICLIKRAVVKEMMQYSVPLVFNQISSWAVNYSDRLIILAFMGISSNGIYSLANKFSNLMIVFFGVYNLAWTENAVQSIEGEKYSGYIKKIVTLTFKIYICIVTGIINVLPLIFKIMVNPNYNAAYQQIPILLVAMFFSGMAATLGSIYIARKKTVSVAITTFLAGAINVIINLCFVRSFGLYAASVSTLIAFIALFFYRYIRIQKFEPIKLEFKSVGIELAILILSWYAFIMSNYILILIGLFLNLICLGYTILGELKRQRRSTEKPTN